MRTAHLFAGAGGGLLADLILGHDPTEAVDINEFCCDLLRGRAADGWFPSLRVHRADVREFDASGWKGRVDILNAGIPCPRWSAARRGAGDPLNLWPFVLRITADARPTYLFLECVEGFKREHERVAEDLRSVGYDITRPLILDAAALGAPHARPRYWAIGYAHDQSEPVRPLNAEVALVPPPDAGDWWETDPRDIRVDDGVARRVERYRAVGNGQVPAQAAAAWLLLGGPSSIRVERAKAPVLAS